MRPDDAPTDLFEIADAKEIAAEVSSGARGKALRERRDIVSGEVMDESQLIRLAIGPEGQILPDLSVKFGGRGVWVRATREAVEIAASKGHIHRSAKRKTHVPDDLADIVETGLRRSVLGMIGMARRAGKLHSGFENVRSFVRENPPAWRIAANDATRDGRNKIRVLSKAPWNATPMLAVFNAQELGAAIGLDDVTHCAMAEGKLAKAFTVTALKLQGFTPLIPPDWTEELDDFAAWQADRAAP